jgi:signal transduction histidine kinase
VRAHGGDITLQSSSDAGTCFVITIPDQVAQLRPGRSGERKVSLKA